MAEIAALAGWVLNTLPLSVLLVLAALAAGLTEFTVFIARAWVADRKRTRYNHY